MRGKRRNCFGIDSEKKDRENDRSRNVEIDRAGERDR